MRALTIPDALKSMLLLPHPPSLVQILPSRGKASPPTRIKAMEYQVVGLEIKSSLLEEETAVVKDEKESKIDRTPAESWDTKVSRD
jgi:hypothetical protein